ncbi:MAG: DUF4007 family protein [Pseudanabaena sp.]|jgi:hypothetical protein
MPEFNLSFHGTFALKKEDILRMIKVAEEEKGADDNKQNLMSRTGLGNEKVLRIKAWSIRSGLVDRETGKLTPQGAIARKHDPYLQSPITDWLMHFYLSFSDKGLATPPLDPTDWGGWTWFVYSFLPNHPSFSRSTLDNAANQIYETDKKKAKSISDDLLKVLKAYTDKKDALAQINFLKSSVKDQYIAGEATLPPDELIAYFLAKICERDFQGLSQINSDRLLQHPYGLSPILGISTDKVQDLLDRLSGKGIIEQYKTVPPFQIIPRWNEPLDLLEKAYVNN